LRPCSKFGCARHQICCKAKKPAESSYFRLAPPVYQSEHRQSIRTRYFVLYLEVSYGGRYCRCGLVAEARPRHQHLATQRFSNCWDPFCMRQGPPARHHAPDWLAMDVKYLDLLPRGPRSFLRARSGRCPGHHRTVLHAVCQLLLGNPSFADLIPRCGCRSDDLHVRKGQRASSERLEW